MDVDHKNPLATPPDDFTIALSKFIEDYCKENRQTSVLQVLSGLERIRYVITEAYLSATLGGT